jgi:hypothetical protein
MVKVNWRSGGLRAGALLGALVIVTGCAAGARPQAVKARPAVARVSPSTAVTVGLADGEKVTVESAHGSLTVPVEITEMPDGVVWLPANSPGCAVRAGLGAGHGSRVTLRRAE